MWTSRSSRASGTAILACVGVVPVAGLKNKPTQARMPVPRALSQKVLENLHNPEYDISMATPRPEPVELHAHAMDNLRYIRRTMERAGSFTAVPGIGGMLMGSPALAAAWIASGQSGTGAWLAVWLADAGVALLVGVIAAAVK